MTEMANFGKAVEMYRPTAAFLTHHLLLRPFFSVKYSLTVEGSEEIEPGTLAIANHQKGDDIPLTAVGWNKLYGRIPRYVMKNNLPSFLALIGGIPIWRTLELRREKRELDRASQRELIEQVRSYRAKAFEYIAQCLAQGQDIFIFPSGSRRGGDIHHTGIDEVAEAYHNLVGESLQITPVALAYESKGLRRKVIMKIGRPVAYRDKSDSYQAIRDIGLLEKRLQNGSV